MSPRRESRYRSLSSRIETDAATGGCGALKIFSPKLKEDSVSGQVEDAGTCLRYNINQLYALTEDEGFVSYSHCLGSIVEAGPSSWDALGVRGNESDE